MSNSRINVMVVDDHDLIREGLNRIISFEEDLMIIGQYNNGKEFLDDIENKNPDVVLLDINMPIKNGLDTLRTLKNFHMDIKIVMLTVEDDKDTIMEAIDLGADAYILKESAGAEVVTAIRTVFLGDKYIDKSLVKVIFSDYKRGGTFINKENHTLNLLTNRELSILYEISRGLKNKEIADKLFLSEKTIKNYITNIFKKINVEDRVQATIYAIRNNIDEFYKNKFK
ncbi:response regulator transcription factor [Clostridium sp. AL.422]|uniref:response regulator transcription factor n=1 Tax=Clostridium TaxID=1485 RepID=UPI00293DA657|nr:MULTISPECIES: response regulator transcription factor [unclassified Clostridium]MDV4149630.1 response regulator transcription factor [Clostridium sp. AL.422]